VVDRTISVRLRADVQDFSSQFVKAETVARRTATEVEKTGNATETATGRMAKSTRDNTSLPRRVGARLSCPDDVARL
jgi:hypothetical protein